MMNRTLSENLFNKALELIPGGVNSPVRAFRNVGGNPFFTKRAKGAQLEDVDGNHYIDYIGTWGPAILGHAPLVVTEAVHEAAKKGVSFGTPNPYEITLAQMIVDWVPSVEKVRCVSSGTEATMSCIRLARGYTGRDKIIKFNGCYHGHVDGLLVAAGSGALTHGEPDSAGIPASYAEQTIVLNYNDAEQIKEFFAARGDEVAAIIVEPFPANAGLIFPKPGYLELLRELTERHGAVLIFDEVMTGFRVAKGGVQELVGVTPDLTAMGKVIGGGLPVGAFGGKKEIMDYLAPDGPVYQAGTLSGNPLAMAAGIAQLKAMEKANGYERLEIIGASLEKGMTDALTKEGIAHTFHRVGSMFCLYFGDREIFNVDDVMASQTGQFKKLFWNMLNNGVYIAPSPYETGFISLAHSEEVIERTVEAFELSIKDL